MDIEQFFEQEKGITIDAARNSNARYTAIDMARFAEKYMKSNKPSQPKLDALLELAVEFGYKEGERGNNLQKALCEFRKEVV